MTKPPDRHRPKLDMTFLEQFADEAAEDLRHRRGCPPEELRFPLHDGRLFELHRPLHRKFAQHVGQCPQCRLDSADWRRVTPFLSRCAVQWRRTTLRWRLALAVLLLALAWLAFRARVTSPAGSEWRRCPSNGHWYALTQPVMGWHEAAYLAERMGGHLAIIRNALENYWIADNVLNFETYGAYIGLREVDREGHWVWVDGSLPKYRNWMSGEPNDDAHGPQDVAHMFGITDQPRGTWNDTSPTQVAESTLDTGIVERSLPPGNLSYLVLACLALVAAIGAVVNALMVLQSRHVLRLQAPQLFEVAAS